MYVDDYCLPQFYSRATVTPSVHTHRGESIKKHRFIVKGRAAPGLYTRSYEVMMPVVYGGLLPLCHRRPRRDFVFFGSRGEWWWWWYSGGHTNVTRRSGKAINKLSVCVCACVLGLRQTCGRPTPPGPTTTKAAAAAMLPAADQYLVQTANDDAISRAHVSDK